MPGRSVQESALLGVPPAVVIIVVARKWVTTAIVFWFTALVHRTIERLSVSEVCGRWRALARAGR